MQISELLLTTYKDRTGKIGHDQMRRTDTASGFLCLPPPRPLCLPRGKRSLQVVLIWVLVLQILAESSSQAVNSGHCLSDLTSSSGPAASFYLGGAGDAH